MLANTDDPERAKWLLHSENQHVWDFLRDIPKYRRLGEAVEAEERIQSYSGRVECESTAELLLVAVLRGALTQTYNETIDRYDGFNGPHKRLLGW